MVVEEDYFPRGKQKAGYDLLNHALFLKTQDLKSYSS